MNMKVKKTAEIGLKGDDVFQSRESITIENDIYSFDLNALGVKDLKKCLFSNLEVAYNFNYWYGKMKGFVVFIKARY